MKKFWKWVQNKAPDGEEDSDAERTLFLSGAIAEDDPWLDPSDISPSLFKEDLDSGTGPITLWINSPGGDVFAAAQIYNMLLSYPGRVTVKIDGIAASAASVIAMAGDRVLVSPVSMLMIHDPQTIAMGDKAEMEKAIAMLDEVKESIINAYATKTGLSRAKLSGLMESETWMNAKKAVELHFADAVMTRDDLEGAGLEKAVEETENASDPEKDKPDKSEENGSEESTEENSGESGEQDGDSGESEEDPDKKKTKGKDTGKSGDASKGKSKGADRIGSGDGYLFQTRRLAAAFFDKVEQKADEEMNTGTNNPVDHTSDTDSNNEDGTRRVDDLMARLELIHSII
ncbi:MAG TPA: peptidase S14 [Lachnospiraceae bacterium]|jgi:ATP-dependent Clp protease protease subunit|nr:peptidase S14 [Lachnospiraceae bacterium]